MQTTAVKFNAQDRPEFFKELRKRVNQHLKENNISRYGNWSMKLKTAIMFLLYITPLVLLLTGVASSGWSALLMWVIMSLGMAGIGFSVMHDANHGSYSRNKRVNQWLGYSMNLLGGFHINWKIQHNHLHHSFTNVEGFDHDIKTPVMRFSPHQKRKKFFRFQAFYAPFFYGIMTLYWIIGKDFIDIVRYREKDLLKRQGLTFRQAMTYVTINKTWYIVLTLVLPMLLVPVPWWQSLLGFLLMHFLCGLLLALVFQPAHVIEETQFFEPDAEGSVENNWAIHQMHTTSNFAHNSRVFSWFIGGLNYQIEHHLFPNICHVHYRRISRIVRETAHEYGIPYYNHKTFFGALKSHFSLLNALGTGKYDQQMA